MKLGHNLNGNHSRTQISAAASGSGYNFGYQGGVYQDGFRTLMAYNGRSFEQGNDYTLSYTGTFSNPDITCTGNGGGSYACGVENEADLARYLNENKLKYQDMLHKTNLGETTDSYSILSTAYFPLNDGGTSTSQTVQIVKLFTLLRALIQPYHQQHIKPSNGVMIQRVTYQEQINELH